MTMALSIAELELQTAEFLPAREVMGGKRGKHDDCGCHNTWSDNDAQVNYNEGGLIVVQANLFNDTF
jgi:hypothetical protein